jgi:hypothetical protein
MLNVVLVDGPTFIFSGVLEGDNDTFCYVIFKRSK